ALAFWRLQPAAAGVGLGGAAALTGLQAAGWSFLAAFLSGRNKLYGGRTLALVHASPASSLAPVVAATFSGVGRRAWSMLLWALALSSAAGAPLALPALWALGVAAGSLGHLAGLLTLIAWVRLAPRALGAVWVGVLVVQVVVIYYALYMVGAGAAPVQIATPMAAATALIFGLPGLVMLLWPCLAPARLGAAYRDGWLRLMELADGPNRPRRSVWPRWAPGAAGAVLAKEWVLAARNPATWFRLAALLLLAGALVPGQAALARLAAAHHDLVVLGAGVGATFFVFGELIAAGFSAEGYRLGLAVLSGTGAARLLAGKFLAISPYALATGLTAWTLSAVLGDEPGTRAAMAGAGLAIGLGQAAIACGGAACDARLTEAEEEHDLAALSALMEQVPRGAGGSLGMAVALLWGAGCVWGAPAMLLAPVPFLALLAGWWRLRDRLGAGFIT
ncbi:MAG TPA: hypothetical protein VNT75_19220, partial [Symbiobacteriaceae bacterium]|nr:hypothetical protein [Symbiobacteriaceae bacterium]